MCEPFLLPAEILTVLSHGGAPVKPLIGVVIVSRGVLIVQNTPIVVSHILCVFVIRAGRCGLIHVSETISRDIDELVKIRQRQGFPCKIGYNAECSNWTIKNRAIQFTDNVSASLVVSQHYQGAQVPGPHLAVQRLLYRRIAYKDKVAALEVEVADGYCMFVFESDGGLNSC